MYKSKIARFFLAHGVHYNVFVTTLFVYWKISLLVRSQPENFRLSSKLTGIAFMFSLCTWCSLSFQIKRYFILLIMSTLVGLVGYTLL